MFFRLRLITFCYICHFSMDLNSCLLIQHYKLDAHKLSAQMAWCPSPSLKGFPSLTVVHVGNATPPAMYKVT